MVQYTAVRQILYVFCAYRLLVEERSSSSNTLRSSSSSHVCIQMRHGMTDNAGLPKQLRNALSAPIAETNPTSAAWKHLSQLLRATLRQRYVAYWSKTMADNSRDSKALWSKLDVLLKTKQQSPHIRRHFCGLLLVEGRQDTCRNSQCSATYYWRPSLWKIVCFRWCDCWWDHSEDLLLRFPPSTACSIQHRHGSSSVLCLCYLISSQRSATHPFVKVSFLRI